MAASPTITSPAGCPPSRPAALRHRSHAVAADSLEPSTTLRRSPRAVATVASTGPVDAGLYPRPSRGATDVVPAPPMATAGKKRPLLDLEDDFQHLTVSPSPPSPAAVLRRRTASNDAPASIRPRTTLPSSPSGSRRIATPASASPPPKRRLVALEDVVVRMAHLGLAATTPPVVHASGDNVRQSVASAPSPTVHSPTLRIRRPLRSTRSLDRVVGDNDDDADG
ncbi:hypothetical protein HK405_002086, partial [Cladochytrium tenue]